MLRWRRGLACALMVCCAFALQAQEKGLWHSFRLRDFFPKTKTAALDDSQISAIRKILMARVKAQEDGWCSTEDGDSWLDGLQFDDVPVNQRVRIVRATAGDGCARGAQGANGGMWLFQIRGQRVQFVGAFGGWGLAVQRAEVGGFHDFVNAWHSGYLDTELSYYRFNGAVYKKIAEASAVPDQNGVLRLRQVKQDSTKH